MAKEEKKETKGEIQRATPTRALSPFEEMDRMFENFFGRGWLRPARWEWPAWGELARPFEGRIPTVDVVDRDADVLVKAEVPGIKKDDLDISVSDNMVTIKGETRAEEEKEEGDYYRREISRGSFSRTVALPSDVDPDKAKASFKDGVLELTIPKVEKSRRRSIKVE